MIGVFELTKALGKWKQEMAKLSDMERYWNGSTPQCDTHNDGVGAKIEAKEGAVFIDGKTRMGPWACMCKDCHSRFGFGLGQGKGQKYKYRAADAKWVKIEG